MINIKNLEKRYDDPILKGINVTFAKNSVSIIVGVNGSGKSTLFDCIVGLKKFSGTILIDNFESGCYAYKSKLFYLPSDFYLPEFMTGREYVSFVLKQYASSDSWQVDTLYDIYGMTEKSHALIETYSFGMKKKIQLIAAIGAKTDYLLADEIFSGLDFETTLLTQEIFKQMSKDTGIVLVTHSKTILERFSEHVFLMSDGKLEKYADDIINLETTIKEMEVVNDKRRLIKAYFNTT
ncbi:ATP-binding cassette domain-containing protein [Lactococcus carnosus]|uniref:ABC transporter ATP-binding protein n=1 Tax=Pseudolactococcus carnosus TaxID=2749961 RepID=A0ABT0AR08_9LACT|nr:ABC transporter ATP-binding protein [Lactococcus carnosus]MDN5475078.1 ABC transporter ATP-binding protein [Lactococcus lactis]SCA91897.1 ABC transporter, ATP-binding protein [Lactococcus piscium]MCJ1968843.1 ABC transporter ATP-binding protein [Lactococcus carnosus]MCJ1971077.1 ABC transporter ATP-binding protein [Lactococcus carnosus]MCJ1987811.1 ABC transporter ATP-binding protein [Lactococcus carnosus]